MSAKYNLFTAIIHVYSKIISFLISNDFLSLINLIMNYFLSLFLALKQKTQFLKKLPASPQKTYTNAVAGFLFPEVGFDWDLFYP